MNSSGTQQTQSSSSTTPWAPQAAALTSAFGDAGSTYSGTTGSSAALPTQYTAGMTPQQLQIYQQMVGAGNGVVSSANTGINTGTAAETSGATGAEGALTNLGAFNPATANNPAALNAAANQYVAGQNIPAQVAQSMVGANQEANQVQLPGINQDMTDTGNQNSSRNSIEQGLVKQGLAEDTANMTNADTGQAYQTGLNLAENQATSNNATSLSALDAALGGGTSLLSSGSSTTSSGLDQLMNSLGLSETGATGAQTNQQAADTNAVQSYTGSQSLPYTSLQNLMSIIGGTNWGGSTTGTSTTTSTPSAMSTIGSLMGAGGSLLGGSNAATGASSGLLGLLMMSDRRTKSDIVQIGTLYDGQPVYRFRYNGSPKFELGLMAQDVERKTPSAVVEINGIKFVNYHEATKHIS